MPQPDELRSGVAEVEWRVELARTGVPTLCVGGARVHSGYDPQREAKSAAQKTLSELEHSRSNLLILVGMGLGYLASELRRQFSGAIAIWDPFPELTRALPLQPGVWRDEVFVTSCLDELEAGLLSLLDHEGLRQVALLRGLLGVGALGRRADQFAQSGR